MSTEQPIASSSTEARELLQETIENPDSSINKIIEVAINTVRVIAEDDDNSETTTTSE
jgi:20S proteasome alpha/beta subunit